MAVMRGVEDGFNVVRAAKEGYLRVSDNRGRILAEITSDSAHFATLLVDVPTTHATTIYLMLGDWFASAERGRIYSYVLTGELLGAGLGFAVTGDVAALSWRLSFLLLAIPAFLRGRVHAFPQ